MCALIGTGSWENFINQILSNNKKLKKIFNSKISLKRNRNYVFNNYCIVDLMILNNAYSNVKAVVLPNLCCDVIIGQDLLKQHSSIELLFAGNRPLIKICCLAVANAPKSRLSENLVPNVYPAAIKSKHYSEEDVSLQK